MTLLVACGLQREASIIARPGLTVVAGGGDSARLERDLEAAIAGATAVLSCGIAGALDPGLRAGDVVIGTLFSREGGSPGLLSASPETLGPGLRRGTLVEWLARHLPNAHVGYIVGADGIIASAAEKAALHASTGALAVDMESHIAARVAARHGLPFAILRTISDTAGHALPPAALVGMKPDGSMALSAVLASIARHPDQLPALIHTGREAGVAFQSLRRAVNGLSHEIGAIGTIGARPGPVLPVRAVHTTNYPYQIDFVWLAMDGEGQLAAMVTAGEGPIPADLLSIIDNTCEFETELLALPTIAQNQMRGSAPSFTALCERGIFVYDWDDVHRAQKLGMYTLVGRPSAFLYAADLPARLQNLATQAKLDVVFGVPNVAVL